MNTIKDLKDLVSTLNKIEYEQICDSIKDSNLHKFFVCIHENPPEALEKIVSDYEEKSRRTLIFSLYEIILDNSILANNVQQKQIYSEVGMAKFIVRKNVLQAQYLVVKNHVKKAIDIHIQSIEYAKKYELYDLLLSILYDLDNLYSVLAAYTDFQKNYEQIKYYEQVRMYHHQAYHLFNKNGIERTIFANNKSLTDELASSLPKLNHFFEKSNSAIVKWYYYRLLIDYFESINDYNEALKNANLLLHFQINKPSINTPNFLAITYKLLTRFNLAQYNFNDALLSIAKAKNLDKHSRHNNGLTLITEFYILFHTGRYLVAKTILNNLEPNNEFEKARNEYYHACIVLFKQVSTGYKLVITKEIEKDKEGWNIYIRLVQILQQLELKKTDVADAYIESLRKHVERNKSREIHPRLLLIVKILRALVKENFHYKDTWQKHTDRFELLTSESNEDYSWKILSPELIRFDVWFEAKARRLTYQEVFNERVKTIKEGQDSALT